MAALNNDSLDDRSIKNRMDETYSQGYTINASLWREGTIDKRFKVGDQNLLSLMYGDGSFYNRRRFYFNLIRRHINMVAGYQRQHRKTSSLIPTGKEDQEIADAYTKLSVFSERKEGFHEYFSQAFENSLDVGFSLLHLYSDYSNDPVSGDLKTDFVPYNSVLIDPFFRKQDLSDCNYLWRRKWISKQIAKQLLPGNASEIEKMRPDGTKDGKFPIQAESINNNQNLFTYDEYYYLDTRPVDIIVDTISGETSEWEENPDDTEDEMEQTLAAMPWLSLKKSQKPTVKLAIFLGGRLMYEGPNLLSVDRYPFVPILCYHDPDITNYSWRIQGMVRNLRDAQFLYNRRKIIELDILESQINSGYKYKVGSVTDEAAFRQNGQGFLIPINDTHEMSDVERIDPPGIPQSMIELSRSLADDITKISGVNEELLGSAEDDKAGILAVLRQGAGLTTLQTIFDKADFSQKIYTSLRIEAIRKNWSNGKIKHIIGRPVDRKLRLANTQKFDVAIEQGAFSTTQQQMELKQLLHFRELGIAIPDEAIIRSATIQNKNELLQALQQQAEAQAQQQQAQAQSQAQQDQIKQIVDTAKAQADIALAKEREASAQGKIIQLAEIQSQTEENRTKSQLNLVEQLIKLEDMQISQIRNSLEIVDVLKSKQSNIIPLEEINA